MKLLPIILSIPLVSLLGEAVKADIWVDGYQRKDGTSVRGHWKTKPNNSIYDNYSHPGNFNPNKQNNMPKSPPCRNRDIVLPGICG